MDFFTRVLSSSGSSRFRDKAKEAENANQIFKEKLGNLKSRLESDESSDVIELVDALYESAFPEDKVFLKTPSRARLIFKKDLIVRLLAGLDSLGVPAMAEMLIFTKKYGPEEVADSLMTLLSFLSPLLEGKEEPEFSTDDVMEAMDEHWHTNSAKGSPLLNMFSSAASSPRASAASLGDSPLHPMFATSPYRRAISDRSMLVSRPQEVSAKAAHDKAFIGASTSSWSSQTVSASPPYPSTDQDFRFPQHSIPEIPAAADHIKESSEKPSSYSLDTVSGLQKIHRRKSSSLKELFAEKANVNELGGESGNGEPTKRNSSSSSWRRNSSELKRLLSNISGTLSPRKSGVAAVDSKEEVINGAAEKEILSSIQYQDKDANQSSRKGSRRISPSPPPDDEAALWREDSGGFSIDLTHSEPSAEMHQGIKDYAAAVEVSPVPDQDTIKSSKSITVEQKDISNAATISTEEPSEMESEPKQDSKKYSLNKDVSGAGLGDSVQIKQSDMLGGHHTRSNSDLTPIKNFLKAESSKQEKLTPQRRSESDVQAKMGKLRKFARHIRSLKSSMESLINRGGSGEIVVKQETMGSSKNGQQREEVATNEHEHGSLVISDVVSDMTSSPSSSSSSSGSSGRDKPSHDDGMSLAPHHLEPEEYAVNDDDDAQLEPHAPELGMQSPGDGSDVHKDAREAQLVDHKEDAGQAVPSEVKFLQDAGDSLSTHEGLDAGIAGLASQTDGDHVQLGDNSKEDAALTRSDVQYPGGEEHFSSSSHSSDEEDGHGLKREEVEVHGHSPDDEEVVHANMHDVDAKHAEASGPHGLDAGNSHMAEPDIEQDGSESVSAMATSIATSLVGNAVQWIVSPFLPSSTASQDADGQPGEDPPLPLKDDKALDSMGSLNSGENKDLGCEESSDKASDAALLQHEDLQNTPETEDVESSSPLQGQGQVSVHESHTAESEQSSIGDKTDSHLSLTHGGHGNSDGSTESLPSNSSIDAALLTGDVNEITDSNKQSDDDHAIHRDQLPSVDAFSTRNIDMADSADNKSTPQAPSSLSSEELGREEVLWSKDSIQEALERKDDTLSEEELNESRRSLDERENLADSSDSKSTPPYRASSQSSEEMGREEILWTKVDEASMETEDNTLPTKEDFNESKRSLDEGKNFEDSVHSVSINGNVNLEKPELFREDEKKENVQRLESNGRELPLVSSEDEAAGERMIKEILVEETLRGQLSTEEMQAIVDEMLIRKNSGESLDNIVQSTDISAQAKQVVMNAIARRRLEEYLRAAAEEERADAVASTTTTAVGDRELPAGVADRENPPKLHGQPTSTSSSLSSHVDSPQKSDNKHVQVTLSDPTMEKWDMVKRSSSKRKGGRLGKWALNYLQCFSKPQTKSHHKTSSL